MHEHDETIAVGAKLRLGLNQRETEHHVVHRVLPAANEHLDYLAVHGRHAGQRSSVKTNWDALRAVREELSIPFIANGGAYTVSLAQALKKHTGAAGVMIARGAIENPWVFRGLIGGSEQPSKVEASDALRDYLLSAKIKKYREFHIENFQRILDASR